MLLAQHKASFVQQWKIEDASHALQIIESADTLELIVPDGLTMWYRQRLTGDYEISYRICMVMQGGKYDRLSDLNCFWAANDPKYPDDLFARSQWRDGIFKNYNTLNLFYVGYGGNDNSTTRFRRYKGEYYGVADDKVKPLLKEYTDASHLLVPNQWYEIRIRVEKGITTYSVNDEELLLTLDVRAVGGIYPTVLGVVLDGLKSEYVDRITASLILKGGQGTMTDLAKEELSTKNIVKVENKNWNWSNDTRKEPRFAILTVDKAQAEGTVITLDGLTSLMDNNQDMFQVTQGKVREGLPMLRAEVRLIGKEGLTGAERDAQLAAFRELILDTNRQNFFIKVNGGKEIHMRGYAPTSAYKAEYEALVAGDTTLDANVYYSNTKGSTWGVKLPVGTRHAYERVPFREAYPDFTKWVDSKGVSNQKWYENFVDEKTIRYW